MSETGLDFSKNCFQSASGVSRETIERLAVYLSLLEDWQKRMNLVSPASLRVAWARHVLDSAQVFPHLSQKSGTILDLGSGAGFPGLVLSIMGCSDVVLVESNKKKCLFLEEVIRQTNCSAKVFSGRIEAKSTEVGVSHITARALAPLDQLLRYSYPLVSSGGACFFLKGESFEQELTQAKKSWSMVIRKHFTRDNPIIRAARLSPEHAPGVLLEIRDLLPRE